MVAAIIAGVLTIAAGLVLTRVRASPSAVVGVTCFFGGALEGVSLLRSSDLTTALLPFVLALVLLAMTAPASAVLRKRVSSESLTLASAVPPRAAGTTDAPESVLEQSISDFQNLTAVTGAVVLFGGVVLLPYSFHIEGTAFELIAGIAFALALVWVLVQRYIFGASFTLKKATWGLVAGNLIAVLFCFLASYGKLGPPLQPTPVARDVVMLPHGQPTQLPRLPQDAATYSIDLIVPSQEDLHGYFVWVANVQQAANRGLDQLPAQAFAEAPCHPVSVHSTHWQCTPIHLGQCKDQDAGPYVIYIMLLSPTDVYTVRTGRAINIAPDQALDPILRTPKYVRHNCA